jgi:hypothetical protein
MRQRAVDQGDKPQAARMRDHHLRETRKDEAVDNCRCAVGDGGECRPVGSWTPCRKLDESHEPAARSQTLDNVTVEQISAGELIEPPRGDEDGLSVKPSFACRLMRSRSERWEFGHSRGAS